MQMFDTAFVTLFHVTAGDPWPDELPMVRGTAGHHTAHSDAHSR